jgi:hypothetical protein
MKNYQDHEGVRNPYFKKTGNDLEIDMPVEENKNIIPMMSKSRLKNSSPQNQQGGRGSHGFKYEYLLLSQHVEEGNKIIWRIRHTPSNKIYLAETDQVMKRLDILGKMPIEHATSIIFSAGMKCILQEVEMKKRFELVN